MASEETRRLLKVFGVAVTTLQDALDEGAPRDRLQKLDAEVAERMREVTALVEGLRGRSAAP